MTDYRHDRNRGLTRGFTMIEMLIVVALVGIVATMAIPSFRHATMKAKESVLKEDLWTLRTVIDHYRTDKGRYPPTLDDVVSSGYLRRIPTDPMTGSADRWIVSYEPLAEDAPKGPDTEEPGVTDVQSGSDDQALDGTYYSEW